MEQVHVYEPLLALNWNLLFTAITVFVLFLILKKFFFEKVHNFMEERENEIQGQFDDAERISKLADEKLAEYEKRIENYQLEGKKIIREATADAEKNAQQIVDRAKEQAQAYMEKSQADIIAERNNARRELKNEIGEIAMLAAEQIIQKSLNDDVKDEIVDDIIREAEERPWN